MSIFDDARDRLRRGDPSRIPVDLPDAGLVVGLGRVGRCAECFALVVLTDTAAHTAWHDDLAREAVRWSVSPPLNPPPADQPASARRT